jgi:DNA end-binding protein Ku
LQQVIDAKVEGREIVAPEEPEAAPTAAVDLMAALKASVERARAARGESDDDGASASKATSKGTSKATPISAAKKATAKKTAAKTPAKKAAKKAEPAKKTTAAKKAPAKKARKSA